MISLWLLFNPLLLHGFMPPTEGPDHRIRPMHLHAPVTFARREKVLHSLMEIDGGEFESAYGPDWRAIINPSTDMPSRIYGGKAGLVIGHRARSLDGTLDQEHVIDACKDFIHRHNALFKVKVEELQPVTVTDRGWVRMVHFQQTCRERAVYGSYLTFIIDAQGNILSMGMNLFPDIDIGDAPEVNEEALRAVITDDVKSDDAGTHGGRGGIEFITWEQVAYPVIGDSGVSFCWAVLIEVRISSPLQRWRYCIDAHTVKILERIDCMHYVVNGRITGEILPEYHDEETVVAALSDLRTTLLTLDEPLFFDPFDADPCWSGTTPGYGWEFGSPEPRDVAVGQSDPSFAHTGANVYGVNLAGPYPSGMPEPQYLTMGQPIDCIGEDGVGLLFWRWLGVKGSSDDRAAIEIWDQSQEMWSTLWENRDEDLYDGGWRPIFHDISPWAAGSPAVSLRWGIGPTNGSVGLCGWNIDDVGLYSTVHTFSDDKGDFQLSAPDSRNMLVAVLEGRYFSVISNEEARITSVKYVSRDSQDTSIHFTRSSTYDEASGAGTVNALDDIDEINAYYHANRMIRHIRQIDPDFLNSPGPGLLPITITVRHGERYNNAFWLPGEGVFLGEGDGFSFRNFAHFSDVVYHEVTHAITDIMYGYLWGEASTIHQASLRMYGATGQFDAMHEAFSDYWACTLNDDSKIGDGGFLVSSQRDCVRNLENDLRYPSDYGNQSYTNSLILSGAMWNVRQRMREESGDLGVRTADTLFHIAREARSRTFRDFLLDVLMVDEAGYASAHVELILEGFGAKGIGIPPPPPTSLTLEETEEGVRVFWARCADAAGYCVYVQEEWWPWIGNGEPRDGLGSTKAMRVDVGDTDNYLLTGLFSGDYIIRVSAYNKYGAESAASPERRLSLGEEPDSPSFKVLDEYLQGMCFIGSV
ncbi:MAG: hypothetical protein ACMUIL_00415 [bacterium]